MSKSDPKTEKAYFKLLALREEIEDKIDTLLNPPKAAKKVAAKAAKKASPLRAAAAGGGAASSGNRKLAIVVGHTRVAPGAYGIAPISASEYVWNTDLAAKITAAGTAAGITVKTFLRDTGGISGAYAGVRQWAAGAAVELHFNAFNGSARGTETLYGPACPASLGWATAVQNAMVALYGRTGNNNRGLKKAPPYDRGRESVNALSTIPSCLIEPFFGDNSTDATLGQNRKQALADAIVATFKRHFGV